MDNKILKIKSFYHYDIKTELVDGEQFGCDDYKMKVAYTKQGDYLGDPKTAYRLVNKYGIIHFQKKPSANIASIGYSPSKHKWYGWSHRAIFGFKPGSKCKIGSCHYRAKNKVDYCKSCVEFWKSEEHSNVVGTYKPNGIQVKWIYNAKTKNKKLHSKISSVFCEYPKEFGKGEWTAKTWEDAKQMAIDFSDGVS